MSCNVCLSASMASARWHRPFPSKLCRAAIRTSIGSGSPITSRWSEASSASAIRANSTAESRRSPERDFDGNRL